MRRFYFNNLTFKCYATFETLSNIDDVGGVNQATEYPSFVKKETYTILPAVLKQVNIIASLSGMHY